MIIHMLFFVNYLPNVLPNNLTPIIVPTMLIAIDKPLNLEYSMVFHPNLALVKRYPMLISPFKITTNKANVIIQPHKLLRFKPTFSFVDVSINSLTSLKSKTLPHF